MAFKFFISTAELAEFKVWLSECVGLNYDNLSDHERHRAYIAWTDELFYLNNIDYNEV